MKYLGDLMVICVSTALFSAVLYLWYFLKRNSICIDQQLVTGQVVRGAEKWQAELDESVEIVLGRAMDGYRLFVWIALVANTCFIVYTGIRMITGSDIDSVVAIILGFNGSIVFALVFVLGYHPFRAGKVLVDKESFRVPGFFRERIYIRKNSNIWMCKISSNHYRCIISNGLHTSYLYFGAESADIVRVWAATNSTEKLSSE